MRGKLGTVAPYGATVVVLLCTILLVLPTADPPSLPIDGWSTGDSHPQVAFFFQATDCDETAAVMAEIESNAREKGLAFRAYLLDSAERLPDVRDRLADRGVHVDVAPADPGVSGLLRQLGHTRSPVVLVTDRSGIVRQIHPLPLQREGLDRLHQSLGQSLF